MRAQLVYEPFAYPSGSALDAQTNPIIGLPWAKMSASAADDDIVITSGGLSYPGASASSGNAASYSGTGKTERLPIGPVITAGTIYYSLTLQMTDVAGMTASPVFVGGFSNFTGTSNTQPTTIGTRLYLKQGPSSTGASPTFQVGVSKNSSTAADIAFADKEFTLGSPVLIVGSYKINGTGAGTDDDAKMYVNPDPAAMGALTPPTVSTFNSPILSPASVGTDLFANGGPAVAGFLLRQGNASVPNIVVDEVRIDQTWAQVTPPTGTTWISDSGGLWSSTDQWSTASPNSADAFVNFTSSPTAPASRTVKVNLPVSLRTINFSGAQSFVLDGDGPLNFSQSAAINVRFAGAHTISAPITLSGATLMSVGVGSTLTLSGDVAAGANAITKSGAGTLRMKNIRAGSLNIVGGMASILPNGTSAGSSNLSSLAIASTATLDLADNDLVIDYSTVSTLGSWSGGHYTGVTGLVASGSNDGAWDGNGIITSQPAALTGLTTLGVAEASAVLGLGPTDTALWSGQTVDGTSVLVRYTYGGDANLDGVINADDYANIDFFSAIAGARGYSNGDFNYDGSINADDYALIDFNANAQGGSLGDSGEDPSPPAIAAVPEPGMFFLSLLTIPPMISRRRRP